MAADPRERDADLLADAVEELTQLPRSPAVEAALHYLAAAPRVEGVLLRRRALALFDAEWATGEHWTRLSAEEAVARRLGVATSTVRGWRWRRDVFGDRTAQHAAGHRDDRKEP